MAANMSSNAPSAAISPSSKPGKAIAWGNLVYRKTARNFNPMMATAADYVIAEVEELVEPGELPPDQVHTPGIFINAIFQGSSYSTSASKDAPQKVLISSLQDG